MTVAGIVVKILGLVCKIPLVYIIGEEGMGYYNSAYTIYNLFFILSGAGLPVAISILVCEENSKAGKGSLGVVFRIVLLVLVLFGVLGLLILWFGAETFAAFIGNPPSYVCILVMAPVFFCVCVAGGLRGYFQGLSRMIPTGVSQLIEALTKAVLGVALALYGVKRGYSLAICASLALVGIAVGSFLSMAYLLLLAIGSKAFRNEGKSAVMRPLPVVKRLFRIALPVTLGSLVLSLSGFLDLAVVMRGLQRAGMDTALANRLYGNYSSLAMPMFNLPTVLFMPISYAVVPRVTEARIRGEATAISRTANGALCAMSIVTMPCVFGLYLLSKPILLLLFEEQAALRAAPLLSVLGPAVFFLGIVTVTGSLLQASGNQMLPVVSMGCGALSKLLVSLCLSPKIGITGAPLGTLCCYTVIAVINLYFAMRRGLLTLSFGKQLWAPLVSGFGCALAGRLMYAFTQERLDTRVSALICIGIAGMIYLFLLFALGGVDADMLSALPLPKKMKTRLCRLGMSKERTIHCENCQGTAKSASLRL